ncbi:hypothetical protein [Peribacillus alkalitolerans]|uniref:hypothetical protein n=1 Tax=Peribacillus alkalitolerans TaxID=1550385 RepID=UPI0013D236ED|nr:hypothetical protein [Peribacillus alkalitolerans]
MKKFRGKRRYFRNLLREVAVEQYDLDFGKEGWFNLWHAHLDFYGFGNDSLRIRREHIKAHIDLYKNLLKKLESFEKPYQSWILIDDEDAGSDAVYIHTPNPNNDDFPLKVEKLNWNCKIPVTFKDLINLEENNVAYYKSESEGGYIIQSKHQGIKL